MVVLAPVFVQLNGCSYTCPRRNEDTGGSDNQKRVPVVCQANKVKLTPPTEPLSRQGSRRRSGLIVVIFVFAIDGVPGAQESIPSYSCAETCCGLGEHANFVFPFEECHIDYSHDVGFLIK